MKETFESLLGMFFLLLLMTVSMSCVAAGIDAYHADSVKTQYVQNIEDSHFSTDVLRQVFDSADEEGYDVDMTLYKDVDGENRVAVVCDKGELGDTNGTYMVRLTLDFDYSFPLMGSVTKHTLLAYAK